MVDQYYSTKQPDTLIHIVNRDDENHTGRKRITPSNQFLMVSQGGYNAGHDFTGPHAHLPQIRTTDKTQEAWIVVNGRIAVDMYDVDDSFMERVELGPGDCYVNLGIGGHGFTILEESTRFYEIKNGPYNGREADKRLIERS